MIQYFCFCEASNSASIEQTIRNYDLRKAGERLILNRHRLRIGTYHGETKLPTGSMPIGRINSW